jgi:O-antigen ligase
LVWLPTEPVSYVPAKQVGSAFSGTDKIWLSACLGFFALAVLLGGSPRPEAAALPLLRGAAVLFAALGLKGITRRTLCSAAPLGCLALGFLVFLPLLHLLPLPPGWAGSLAGREVLGEIDQAIGNPNTWRPLSLSPLGTANALLAASVPLAALLLGLNVVGVHHYRLAQGLLGLGMVSLCLALGQTLAPQDSVLYLYETTNRGSPVGVFANRNHHAVFLACLIVVAPIALSFERIGSGKDLTSNGGGLRSALLLVMCLWIAGMALLTGSRSGALATSLALLSVPMIMAAQARAAQPSRTLRRSTNGLLRSLVLMVGLGIIIPFAIWVERAPAIDRLLGSTPDADARLKILPQVLELIWLYWPWGSGPGSFEKVFQLHEPHDLLSAAYMNHAHNDVLEVAMTAGLAGLILMLSAAALWLVLAVRVLVIDRSDRLQPLRKAGVVIILILSVASLTDYPLRNPGLAALYVLAWIWAALPYRPSLSR